MLRLCGYYLVFLLCFGVCCGFVNSALLEVYFGPSLGFVIGATCGLFVGCLVCDCWFLVGFLLVSCWSLVGFLLLATLFGVCLGIFCLFCFVISFLGLFVVF